MSDELQSRATHAHMIIGRWYIRGKCNRVNTLFEAHPELGITAYALGDGDPLIDINDKAALLHTLINHGNVTAIDAVLALDHTRSAYERRQQHHVRIASAGSAVSQSR